MTQRDNAASGFELQMLCRKFSGSYVADNGYNGALAREVIAKG